MHFIFSMEFDNKLITWYLQNKRNLPWRENIQPYFIWLSEIMLQQTRVEQGLPYFLKFVDAFPTVEDLAQAEESQVLKLWQGLGYYSRARNLHFTAKKIVFDYKGVFPKSYAELIKLKGVGDYTASAISSICFNEPKAVVDGNVYRVLSRYFEIDTPINTSAGVKEFKKLAQELIPDENPGDYNQAIMELGATVCKPQNPTCFECVLNDSCLALKNNKQKQLPVKENKTRIKTLHLNYLVTVSADCKTIVEKRNGKGIWQNLYQFPVIETEVEIFEKELNEHPILNKYFQNEPIKISLFNQTPILHKLSHRNLYTKFWIIKCRQSDKCKIEWSNIEDFPVPVLIANFLKEFKVD